MTLDADSPRPPAWAESVLRALLDRRSRDAITGDLLEEYREVMVPLRGDLRARLWYLKQVSSFIVPRLVMVSERLMEGDMSRQITRDSWLWLASGIVALATLIGLLVRSNFGPPPAFAFVVGIALVMSVARLLSIRTDGDVRRLWRIGLVCGAMVTVVLLIRLMFDVLDPVDPVDRFLARARDDYSEFDYPRRWMPAAAISAILIGSGLWAAWQTRRVGFGTMTAIAAGLVGSLTYVLLVAAGNLLPLGPQDPLANTPAHLRYFGNAPAMLVPVLAMFSTVLGAIGAMFGRALSQTGLTPRKTVQEG